MIPRSDTIADFTSQISGKLGSPFANGSFGDIYRCTIESSTGKMEVGLINSSSAASDYYDLISHRSQ